MTSAIKSDRRQVWPLKGLASEHLRPLTRRAVACAGPKARATDVMLPCPNCGSAWAPTLAPLHTHTCLRTTRPVDTAHPHNCAAAQAPNLTPPCPTRHSRWNGAPCIHLTAFHFVPRMTGQPVCSAIGSSRL
eukprot:364949-Chlamydomonas_euryale.AAC.2